MLRLFTRYLGCYFDDYFRNIGVGLKVGKCTGMKIPCLEMGSYDTP